MMAAFGFFGLLAAFVATMASIVLLAAGHALRTRPAGETISWAGRVAALVSCGALTFCCIVLLFAFLTGDYSLDYVLREHSSQDSLLLQVSGVWAGRQGSLLLWAWLISVFNAIMSWRRMDDCDPLDNMAVLVGQTVLAAFASVMLFSSSNFPFAATDAVYYSDGVVTDAGKALGMNVLLEHWAMAIHPPTLFVGYAGLTVPFAYAIAALIVSDPSKRWVEASERFALVAWFMLTVGIGLGGVWAYTVLGWGGFWGWDPVENASLLPWLVCLALVHSFRQYKRRGIFKRWAAVCACLAFAFCIVGTFISRSGLVQSVHAFEGDPVSLVLFGALIAVSMLAGIAGVAVRRASFVDDGEPMTSFISREGAFWLNNLLIIIFAVVLAYLTTAQALPEWMPLGGTSVGAATYEAIARPVGMAYLLLLAVCPLLSWGKTDKQGFLHSAKIPAVCAAVAFAALAGYVAIVLIPRYDAIIAAGGTAVAELAAFGPAAYYHGLAFAGCAVAALLLFNSVFQIVRMVRPRGKGARGSAAADADAGVGSSTGTAASKGKGVLAKLPALGSSVSHAAMAFILLGLIGSMMYVTERTGCLASDDEGVSTECFSILDYDLWVTGLHADESKSTGNVDYVVEMDVRVDDRMVGHVSPSFTWVETTQQQRLNAGVLSLPTEDVFVVFQGLSDDGGLNLDVRVNPLVGFVWVGFFLLCVGMLLSCFVRRRS